MDASACPAPAPAIEVTRFNFAHGSGGVTAEPTASSVLREVSLRVPRGARVVVVGLNGVGKTALLRCLAGLHFHDPQQILVLGRPAFFSGDLAARLTYLGSDWRTSSVVRSDIPVDRVLRGALGFTEAKLAHLVQLLDVDAAASMARLSDGQRQGVQIAAALMKDFQVLLMDETTVECDVLVRKRLLAHLKAKTEQEGSTILYATHVLDGLASWPTHLLHVDGLGHVSLHPIDDCAEYQHLCATWDPSRNAPLSALVELWLERDYELRKTHKRPAPAPTLEQTLNQQSRTTGDRFYNYYN